MAREDLGTGGPAEGPDEPDDGGFRNRRIQELRDELDELRNRIADQLAAQRRATMQLHALLEEQRHIARRARRQEGAARWHREEGRDEAAGRDEGQEGEGRDEAARREEWRGGQSDW